MKQYFSRCILSVFVVTCFAGQVPALDEGVLSSFYIEREKEEQRWSPRGEGIISWPAMSDLDDYVSWINRTWNGNISKIKTCSGYSGGVTYMIDRNHGVGVDYETLSGRASGTTLGGTNKFRMTTSTEGISGILVIKHPDVIENLNVMGELGIGYYRAKYSESENAWEQKGDDFSIGCKIGGKLEYCFGRNISLLLSGGYRILKLDDFGVNLVSPGNPPVELDFSGWFAGIGISCMW